MRAVALRRLSRRTAQIALNEPRVGRTRSTGLGTQGIRTTALQSLSFVLRACAVPKAVRQMTNPSRCGTPFEAAHERARRPAVGEEG